MLNGYQQRMKSPRTGLLRRSAVASATILPQRGVRLLPGGLKNRSIPNRKSGTPLLSSVTYSPQYAIASISTSAAFGRAATSNAALAGHAPSKKVA